MDLIDGIPAHPLVVHLPVVLIPLALVAAILMLVRPQWRKASWVVVALAGIGLVGALLAENSGEALEKRVQESEAVEEHAEQGELVPPVTGLFVLAAAGVAGSEFMRQRKVASQGTSVGGVNSAASVNASARDTLKMASTVLAVASVLTGAGATYVTYAAGHSGAKSAWEDAAKTQPRAEREGEEGEEGEGEEEGEDGAMAATPQASASANAAG